MERSAVSRSRHILRASSTDGDGWPSCDGLAFVVSGETTEDATLSSATGEDGAEEAGSPVVSVIDGSLARIEEGLTSTGKPFGTLSGVDGGLASAAVSRRFKMARIRSRPGAPRAAGG